MESYCVIQFKDKQEKGKILTFLAVETEAEYKVTADLKGFVAKQFNVTILENVVANATDINTVDIKRENIGNTVDIVSPTVDALHNEQHSTQSFSIPDPIVVDQPIPVIDNTQNLMNMNDYETYVPYLERPIELKEETFEDLVDMEVIGNDSVDNISVDDVRIINHVDAPSSSTTRRLNRNTKRTRHSTANGDTEEEDTSVIKHLKKNKASVGIAREKTKKTLCQKCGAKGKASYSAKIDHAIAHSDIMTFECSVMGCGVKYKSSSHIRQHMRRSHKTQLNSFAKIQLTSEQKSSIDSMMGECFNDSNDDNCQICHQSVGGDNLHFNILNLKKEHALHHVDFMLYKCTENRCSFGSKTDKSMKLHVRSSHPKIANPTLTKIKLTAEQELEIEDMLVKCFPNLNKEGS